MLKDLFNFKQRKQKRQVRDLAEKLAIAALDDFESGKLPTSCCPNCASPISIKQTESLLSAHCPCEMSNVALLRQEFGS